MVGLIHVDLDAGTRARLSPVQRNAGCISEDSPLSRPLYGPKSPLPQVLTKISSNHFTFHSL